MSNPFCTCSASWSPDGSTYHQCDGCKRGVDAKTIIVDHETWPQIQRILNGERLPERKPWRALGKKFEFTAPDTSTEEEGVW